MRKLMWFVIGFTAGCALGLLLFQYVLLPVLALGFLAGSILSGFVGVPSVPRKIVSLVLAGCAVGTFWIWGYDLVKLQTARAYDTVTLDTVIEVADYSYVTSRGAAADGKIELEGKTYKVRFYTNTFTQLQPGDRVRGSFTLRFTGFGGDQSPTYHQGKGIFLIAYPDGDLRIDYADEIPAKYFAAKLRRNILDTIDTLFPEDTLGFARALLLGDSGKLSEADDKAFQISGIRHIIAVSGLHVSILFGFVCLFIGRQRHLSVLVSLPLLVLFAAVAGFTPSITRACVMQGLIILSELVEKEYDPPTSLSFAVLVILMCNPIALTTVSFQLSVGCIIGIFLFSGRINSYLMSRSKKGLYKNKGIKGKLFRWLCQSVSVSIGAISLTTPMSAYYFGYISLVSVLTNLLTLWIISLIFYGIVVGCVVGSFWTGLGSVIAWCVSWGMRYVLLVAKLVSAIPFAAVSAWNIYIMVWLIFTYLLVAVFLCIRPRRPLLLVGCILAGLVCSLTCASLETRRDNYRMTVLDVGQGQCILLQSQDQCYVVDCGGDYASSAADLAAQTLRTQGISKIDGLILTHFDADHAGGARDFLAQIQAERIYLPDADEDNELRLSLEADYSSRIRWVREEQDFTCGKGELTIYPAQAAETGNNSSLCILFQAEDCDILITGDRSTKGEEALLEQADLPDLEILVAGHHGAESSTSLPLLTATTPESVVISVGRDNSYGHPTQSVLNRLQMCGCAVWRTDIHGTIVFRG